MIECVQNHAPEVMVLDEIGRRSEADAAMTCKNRGVRMIASAHGNLRSLVENPELSGTIGGTQNVILGDVNAVRTTSGALRKVVAKSGLALLHLMSLLRFNVAATTTAK
jgi:stage III sporulation protein SpoIIIAA